MQLLPVYYTTLNTKKRRKPKKSRKQLKAEQDHQIFLRKVGFKGDKKYVVKSKPNYDRKSNLPACSDVIPTGVAYKKKYTDHNFTIAPAYNKGSYQVISKKNIKDIGK